MSLEDVAGDAEGFDMLDDSWEGRMWCEEGVAERVAYNAEV